MKSRETIELAWEALKERKTRAILTILMVVVGSSLMTSLNGMSGGFTQFTEKRFSSLAPNVLLISSAARLEGPGGGGGGGVPPAPTIALTSVVVNEIKHLPAVNDAIPDYSGQVSLEGKGKTINVRVIGVDPEAVFKLVPNAEFDEGSSIVSHDPSVVVVAENIARPPVEAFPFAVLGQAVQAHYSYVDSNGVTVVNTRSFVVKAILKVTGSNMLDNAVIIPIDAATSLMHKGNKYDGMIVVAKSPDLVTETQAEITHLYGNNIGITSSRAILNTILAFRAGTNNFILSVAMIALLVGAIGIVTTLYTSVMERTREIGTMKAIGAQNRNILSMFLSEAVFIGIIGASVGLLVGFVGGYALTASQASPGQQVTPVYLPNDLTTVWLLSVGLAALAGFYPALKGSKLQPIVALRRE